MLEVPSHQIPQLLFHAHVLNHRSAVVPHHEAVGLDPRSNVKGTSTAASLLDQGAVLGFRRDCLEDVECLLIGGRVN